MFECDFSEFHFQILKLATVTPNLLLKHGSNRDYFQSTPKIQITPKFTAQTTFLISFQTPTLFTLCLRNLFWDRFLNIWQTERVADNESSASRISRNTRRVLLNMLRTNCYELLRTNSSFSAMWRHKHSRIAFTIPRITFGNMCILSDSIKERASAELLVCWGLSALLGNYFRRAFII